MVSPKRFHGVVHAIPFDGNYTSEMFEHAVRHIVLPSLPRDSYLMMDNASIQNDNRLTNILQTKNITPVKLSMYSYNLSPIEMVFSVLKAYILRDRSNDTKPVKILKAFNQVRSMFSGVNLSNATFLHFFLVTF